MEWNSGSALHRIYSPVDEKRKKNTNGGIWEVSNNKAYIISQTDSTVELMIKTGRSGEFDLIYKKENEEDVVLHITINSL